MLQLLPGGPDETPSLSSALSRRATALAAAEQLLQRCVPRPAPPRYLALQQEVAAFLDGLGRPQRLLALAAALRAGAGAATGALQEGEMWASSAESWAERLGEQYLGYADILQPVQLAVSEVCHGLRVMRGAAQAAVDAAAIAGGDGACAESLRSLTAGMLAFPTPTAQSAALLHAASGGKLQPLLPPSALAETHLKAAASAALEQQLQRQQALRAPSGAGGGRAAEIAAYTWQLQSARAALHAAVMEALIAARGGSGGGAVAVERANALFGAFLDAWRQLREYEARAAEEKDQMFKTKSKVQSSTHMTEEVGPGCMREGRGVAWKFEGCLVCTGPIRYKTNTNDCANPSYSKIHYNKGNFIGKQLVVYANSFVILSEVQFKGVHCIERVL